jgi:hypothetical protein
MEPTEHIVKLCEKHMIPYLITNENYQIDFFTSAKIQALPRWNGRVLEIPNAMKTLLWKASGCHEIAHWLIADPGKRQYYDFGLCSISEDALEYHKSVQESWAEEFEAIELGGKLHGMSF